MNVKRCLAALAIWSAAMADCVHAQGIIGPGHVLGNPASSARTPTDATALSVLAQPGSGLGTGVAAILGNTANVVSGVLAGPLVTDNGSPISNGAGSSPCSIQFGNSFTKFLMCSTPSAPHSNGTLSAFSVITNPVGSANVGQPYADYAAQLSVTKQNYLTSTVAGELSGLQLTAWQGAKDDVSALEATAVKVRGTGFDEGGVIGLGDIAASWVNSSGVNQWETHGIIGYGAASGDPVSAGAGYGISTEAWLGTPYAAYMVNTFNGYSGTHAFTRAFAAGHDRSLSDIYFQVAGDAPASGSLNAGDITQGYPGFSVTSHVDASGNWCLLNDALNACGLTLPAAITSAAVVFRPFEIAPPSGNNVALDIVQTLSGGTGVSFWNQINIVSDSAHCAFCVDFYDQHPLGGANIRGAKVGYASILYQTSANTGSGATAVVGLEGIGQSNSGDGGTGLTNALVQGTYFGQNVIARNSGTNIQELVASEADTMTSNIAGGASANSSARYTFGYTAANYEAVQGASLDAAYAVYSGGSIAADHGGGPWGPGVGYHCGLCFAELSANGLTPLDSGATVLGSYFETLSNIPVAYGVDLRGFTFSQKSFASTGFSVNATGAVTSTLPTSAGGSGIYVCVDSAGVFYKKASCP